MAVDKHLDLTLFSADHHRLAAHAAHHVKRVHRSAPQGQFKGIFLNTFFKGAFEFMLDLKKPVGRAQAPDTLMRPLVIVIFYPECRPFHRLLKAVELRTEKKLILDAFPEPLDFTQRHWMVGAGSNVLDAVLFHLPLKPGLAAPVGILPAIVGKHLTGYTIFSNPPTVGLQHVCGGLAAI